MICPVCGATVTAAPQGGLWSRCHACEAMVFESGVGPPVLIAHESEEICQQLGAVVLAMDLSPIRAGQGAVAMHLLRRHQPVAAVLDVGLRGEPVFLVVDAIRSDEELRHVAIILVASVFNRTAYKRRPHSLYGANDYVEQHHIPDMLPEKLGHLLGIPVKDRPHQVEERVERIRLAVQRRDLAGQQRVRALAQSIVADIALYHQAEIEALVGGDVRAGLDLAIEEGRSMLAHAVGQEADGLGDLPPDPIASALHELVETLKRRRGTE